MSAHGVQTQTVDPSNSEGTSCTQNKLIHMTESAEHADGSSNATRTTESPKTVVVDKGDKDRCSGQRYEDSCSEQQDRSSCNEKEVAVDSDATNVAADNESTNHRSLLRMTTTRSSSVDKTDHLIESCQNKTQIDTHDDKNAEPRAETAERSQSTTRRTTTTRTFGSMSTIT